MWSSKTDRFSSGRALYPRAIAAASPLGRSGLRDWTGFYGAVDKSGLVAEIESYGFDIDDVQAAMNLAAEKNNGISWDLIPPSLPV